MEHAIGFPILCLDIKGTVLVQRTKDDLETCTSNGLSNGYYSNLTLIDSSKKKWTVIDAVKIGNVGGLWGWRLPFFSRLIHVRLSISPQGVLTLEAIKQLVIAQFEKLPHLWEASDDLDTWKSRVMNATTFEELLELFHEP
ncbi:MAG: hypothetical protein WDN01_14150 [Rhizomicrobium sp.]